MPKNCTVSFLSWKRVENLNKIINVYNTYDCVTDIIIWNNNPNFLVSDLGLQKVRVVNCSKDFGLDTRFISTQMANNRCVITHDDDLMLSEINLLNLITHWEEDCSRIYTYEGRNIENGKYSCAEGTQRIEGFDAIFEPTEVDVALTRTLCFDKLLSAEYMKWSDAIFYDTSLNLNGEDIAFSYIARKCFGKKPIVLPVPDKTGYIEIPGNDKISERPGFIERRSQIANRCDKLFPSIISPKEKTLNTLEVKKNTDKLIIFGPGFYPVGTHPSSWVMNCTLKKFTIEDTQDGKMMWIQSEKDMDFILGLFAFRRTWSPVSLDINDTIYMKCCDLNPDMKIVANIVFLPLKGSKEVTSNTIDIYPSGNNQGRISEISIPISKFLEEKEHKELFLAGKTRSVTFICQNRKADFIFKILELKVVGDVYL